MNFKGVWTEYIEINMHEYSRTFYLYGEHEGRGGSKNLKPWWWKWGVSALVNPPPIGAEFWWLFQCSLMDNKVKRGASNNTLNIQQHFHFCIKTMNKCGCKKHSQVLSGNSGYIKLWFVLIEIAFISFIFLFNYLMHIHTRERLF